MADLGLLGVDLGEELKVDGVGDLFGCGGALEAERLVLEVELQLRLGHVGGDDGEVNIVLLGLAAGRALGPGHWFRVSNPSQAALGRGCGLPSGTTVDILARLTLGMCAVGGCAVEEMKGRMTG